MYYTRIRVCFLFLLGSQLTFRMTFLFRPCSDRDIPNLDAKCRIERLKCAEPVKYSRAQPYSS